MAQEFTQRFIVETKNDSTVDISYTLFPGFAILAFYRYQASLTWSGGNGTAFWYVVDHQQVRNKYVCGAEGTYEY